MVLVLSSTNYTKSYLDTLCVNTTFRLIGFRANSVTLGQRIRSVGGPNMKLQRNPVSDFCLGHCVSDVARVGVGWLANLARCKHYILRCRMESSPNRLCFPAEASLGLVLSLARRLNLASRVFARSPGLRLAMDTARQRCGLCAQGGFISKGRSKTVSLMARCTATLQDTLMSKCREAPSTRFALPANRYV